MIIKEKRWYWLFWRKNAFTTIWETIYCPPGETPSQRMVAHEEIHSKQQKKWGKVALPLWIYLYLIGFPLGLPIIFNPWRKKWELEAYTKGSLLSKEEARKILRSSTYGWLL